MIDIDVLASSCKSHISIRVPKTLGPSLVHAALEAGLAPKLATHLPALRR